MSSLRIEFRWEILDLLHIGTGLSRIGYADRVIRVDHKGIPFIPGGAVKGAVRGAAERVARWLCRSIPPETETESMPKHPMLRRIFAPQPGDPFCRFVDARLAGPAGEPMRLSSTAINDSGSAKANTLRTIEAWNGSGNFASTIEVLCPELTAYRASRGFDLDLLLAAILSVEAIGGKKNSGFGAVKCALLKADGIDIAQHFTPDRLVALGNELEREEGPHANVAA